MIDSHCHLNFHKFENDVDEVIKDARDAGIKAIVNVGTKIDSSEHAVRLAEEYEMCWAIVGVHPHHADKLTTGHPDPAKAGEGSHYDSTSVQDSSAEPQNDNGNWIEQLEKIAQHPKVIGIGECGLDYFSYKSNGIVDPKIQREMFEQQIILSQRLGLPLQIHNRHAGNDVIEVLKQHKDLLQDIPGVFHCFAGSKEVLQEALDLGFYIGFDGNITYKGLAPGETVSLPDIARDVPMDRILIETDSPYLTPIPYRGMRNTPKNVIIVGEYIADLKRIKKEIFFSNVQFNFYRLFGKAKQS